MTVVRMLVIALALGALAPQGGCGRDDRRPVAPRSIGAGRLGSARLYAPAGALLGFVYLFSDATGPTPALERDAEALARAGAATVLVDLGDYLKGLAASDDGCHYVVSELEELSKREQRELGTSTYHSPILVGVGQGGALAYAALAQSPAATLAGAVAVDPSASLATRVALCEGAPATALPSGGFQYASPREPLQGTFRTAPASDLVAAVTALLPHADVAASPTLADLPLVRLPAAEPGTLFAVVYSGDGGWRDLDKTIGEFLAEHGVPVVGVDSLRYFWRRRTPEEIARDLAAILEDESARGAPDRGVILIGYSFGADVLPFAWNRLPERWRERVVEVSLLGLGSHATFEFHLSDWLHRLEPTGLPILPELLQMDLAQVQCFYGQTEVDTLCPRPELAGAEVIGTLGSHHFDGDYPKLAQRILDGALRRAAARSPDPRLTRRPDADPSAPTSLRSLRHSWRYGSVARLAGAASRRPGLPTPVLGQGS